MVLEHGKSSAWYLAHRFCPSFRGVWFFKERTRTWKNLLSLSYSFKLSCVRLKAWIMASPFSLRVSDGSPLKIPPLTLCMELRGGVDLESAFASGQGQQHTGTCIVSWTSDGTRRDFLRDCSLALTSVVNCWIDQERWFKPHFSVRASLLVARWGVWVTQVVTCTPIWPAYQVKTKDRSKHSSSQDVINIWDFFDSELQYIAMEIIRSLQKYFQHRQRLLRLGNLVYCCGDGTMHCVLSRRWPLTSRWYIFQF